MLTIHTSEVLNETDGHYNFSSNQSLSVVKRGHTKRTQKVLRIFTHFSVKKIHFLCSKIEDQRPNFVCCKLNEEKINPFCGLKC